MEARGQTPRLERGRPVRLPLREGSDPCLATDCGYALCAHSGMTSALDGRSAA
jgi:hypothetical protein